MSFCSENVQTWHFSCLRMGWTCLQYLSRRAVSCFSRSPVAENHKNVSTFSIQLCQTRLRSSIGWQTKKFPRSDRGNRIWPSREKKRVRGDFLQLGPRRSGKLLYEIGLAEKFDPFWGEQEQFHTFSEQKFLRTWRIFQLGCKIRLHKNRAHPAEKGPLHYIHIKSGRGCTQTHTNDRHK